MSERRHVDVSPDLTVNFGGDRPIYVSHGIMRRDGNPQEQRRRVIAEIDAAIDATQQRLGDLVDARAAAEKWEPPAPEPMMKASRRGPRVPRSKPWAT